MIRFLTFLLGKQYEPCKSCQTLKEQLAFERDEKKRLTDTLIQILKPTITEAIPIEIAPVTQIAGSFARRRSALEARDREEARILQEKKHLAIPDSQIKTITNTDISVEKLEQELGVSEELEKAN